MTDVFTLLGRAAFFSAPFRNSISSACRPTMRSNAAILASYSWSSGEYRPHRFAHFLRRRDSGDGRPPAWRAGGDRAGALARAGARLVAIAALAGMAGTGFLLFSAEVAQSGVSAQGHSGRRGSDQCRDL